MPETAGDVRVLRRWLAVGRRDGRAPTKCPVTVTNPHLLGINVLVVNGSFERTKLITPSLAWPSAVLPWWLWFENASIRSRDPYEGEVPQEAPKTRRVGGLSTRLRGLGHPVRFGIPAHHYRMPSENSGVRAGRRGQVLGHVSASMWEEHAHVAVPADPCSVARAGRAWVCRNYDPGSLRING